MTFDDRSMKINDDIERLTYYVCVIFEILILAKKKFIEDSTLKSI